jgi:hypothetical protein
MRLPLPELFYTAEDLIESLDPGVWEIVTAAAPTRTASGPDGDTVVIRDTVLHARRRGGA